MKIIIQKTDDYLLRFDRGEEVFALLKNFCNEQKITAASFQAFGAVEEVTISYYDLATKTYLDQTFHEDLEIVSVLGNISVRQDAIVVHAHGSFSDRAMQVRGGHIKKMIISATCELTLQKFEGKIERKYDEGTGLNLMN